MSPSTYVVHTGDAASASDRDVALGIWRGNLGQEARMVAKLDWFYRSCPWGSPLLQLLRHEPSAAWVGIAAAGPRRLLDRGQEIDAGVLVDFSVTPKHRYLGPALLLQKALMAASHAHFDFLYGFPNPKAAPVLARAGYSKIGDLVRYARVLRYGAHLERRLPRAVARPLGGVLDRAAVLRAALVTLGGHSLTAEWHDAVDPRIDALWSEADHGYALVARRDTAMLRWRFDHAPFSKVRYLLLSEGGPAVFGGEVAGKGRLVAWFACQADFATLHVRDFWSTDAAQGIGRRFIEALLREARRAGHSVVSLEYAGPAKRRAGWLAAGFVERSRRPIYGKWRASPPCSEEDIHFTAADEDE